MQDDDEIEVLLTATAALVFKGGNGALTGQAAFHQQAYSQSKFAS